MPQTPTWSQFEPHFEALEQRPLTLDSVTVWLHDWSELEKEFFEHRTALWRAKNEDTRDKEAETAYLAFVHDVIPPAHLASHRLNLKLLALDGLEPDAEQREFIKRFRNEAELFREENVPLYAEETALSSEYNKLMGALTAELDGEKLTIPAANKKLQEPDRDLRERAWRAVAGAKGSIREELDALFLKLHKLRRQIAQNAGFEDYRAFRWQQLNRFDYTPEDSLAFHDSIASEAVPLVTEVREERREEMNLPTLRPWDLCCRPASTRAARAV